MNRLQRLAQRAPSYAIFLTEIKTWGGWFLESEQQRKMTKLDFEKYYGEFHK